MRYPCIMQDEDSKLWFVAGPSGAICYYPSWLMAWVAWLKLKLSKE